MVKVNLPKKRPKRTTSRRKKTRSTKKHGDFRKNRNVIFPSRGIIEDYSPENEEKLLEKKKDSASKMIQEGNVGSPEFGSLLSGFITGEQQAAIPVEFKLDKEYRPSFNLIRDIQENKVEGPITVRMDPQIQRLAQDQVLVRLKKMKIVHWDSFRNTDSQIMVITTVADDYSKDPVKYELKSFTKIKKGDNLNIGVPYGVMMYHRAGRVPSYLDMRILVARSRKGIRDVGEALDNISKNTTFQSAVQTLSSLATGPIGIVSSQVDKIIGIIGSILMLQQDDQLLYYAATLSRDFDNLGADKQEICDSTRSVEFCYQVQVGKSKE